MDVCAEPECDNPTAIRLYIPWDDDRDVCAGHARVLVQQDGVVAEPLDDATDAWHS